MEHVTLVASLHHTISSHTSDINDVCYSKDNKLATCSGDKTVRLWDPEEYTELECSPLCGHSYYVHCCVFSPFGTQLATCSTDGKIIIWDVKAGTKIGFIHHHSRSPIRVCRFSSNSKYIVSGCDDETLCIWEVSTQKLIRSFKGHEATVFGVCFSPDCLYVVSGSSNGDLFVWDAVYGHGKPLALVEECHDLGVMCCEFSPTYGSAEVRDPENIHFLLATCGQDDLVKLWDFVHKAGAAKVTVSQRNILRGHGSCVNQCTFSNNGRLLASASSDKTLRLWDPLTGTPLHTIDGHSRYVTSCAFSSNGQYLASGSNDKTVMIWKITTDEQIFEDLANNENLIPDQVKPVGAVKRDVRSWSVEEVCQWAVEIGMSEYATKFRAHHIDGQEFLQLSHNTLQRDMGIESLGHRNKILRMRMKLTEDPGLQKREGGGAVTDHGIPDEYLCPITREIMKDPVIMSDGYTYERAAITAWMKKGKDRSPMTNAILNTNELTPNRSLKMLIQRYLNG